jgi:hypothetical protein
LLKRTSLVALVLSISACNAVTGVGDLEVGAGGGGGGSTVVSSLIAVPGVTLAEISLYQAVKRPLMRGGAPAMSDVPIVAGRDALVRVFVTTDASFTGKPLTARFLFDGKSPPIEVTQTLTGASTDAQLGSTLNLTIPGDKITVGMTYQVQVGTPSTVSSTPAAVAYPAMGFDPIPAESVGPTLKVVIAPIAYGSTGHLPDTSDAQMKMYTDAFHAMYPAPKVEVTVRSQPIPWKQTVGADGSGWDALLQHVGDVRQQDKAPPDVYYFAPFEPTADFGQFCGGGCVAGLGMLGMPGDAYSRAAIGLGYPGDDTGITALHEIGHNHGRHHSPCMTPDADPQFPHPGGTDGVWGYNLVKNVLYPPETTDIMGYCMPVWISDYTYKGLFTRIKLVNKAEIVYPAELVDRDWDRVLVSADGSVKWLDPIHLDTPPMAEEASVTVTSRGVVETLKGAYYRFDHVDGGLLFWPASDREAVAVEAEIDPGQVVRAAR